MAVAEPREVVAAVDRAASVQPLWAMLRLGDRARYMARAAQAIIDEFDELTDLIVAEQGRPRAEVEVMELLAAVETLQWLAEHGPRILAGERIPFARTQHPVKRGRWSYEPLGVVGILGPAAGAGSPGRGVSAQFVCDSQHLSPPAAGVCAFDSHCDCRCRTPLAALSDV